MAQNHYILPCYEHLKIIIFIMYAGRSRIYQVHLTQNPSIHFPGKTPPRNFHFASCRPIYYLQTRDYSQFQVQVIAHTSVTSASRLFPIRCQWLHVVHMVSGIIPMYIDKEHRLVYGTVSTRQLTV